MEHRAAKGRRAIGAVAAACGLVTAPAFLPSAGLHPRSSPLLVASAEAPAPASGNGKARPAGAPTPLLSLAVCAASAAAAGKGLSAIARHASRQDRFKEGSGAAKALERVKREAEEPDEGEEDPDDAEPVEEPPFDFSAQLGVTEPLGFFDPAGLSKDATESDFRQLRAAEIKHGRVAMMASLGAVVQHYIRYPDFEDCATGIGAAGDTPSVYGLALLVIVAGFLELIIWVEPEDRRLQPGDFGDPIGLGQYDKDWRNRELNNGRFAMFAAMGIILGEVVSGKDAIQQLGLP